MRRPLLIQPDASTTVAGASGEFRHAALLYSGERSFVDATAAFVREGVAAGDPTLVVVSARKVALLRDELGPDADRVLFADMDEIGTNPGRIISAWDDFLREHGGEGRPVRGIGEPIGPDRSAAELTECHRHEALLNLAFAGAPAFQLLCPYDVDALDPAVVDHARVTHPLVVADGAEAASDSYAGLESVCAPLDDPLPAPPARAHEVPFDADVLGAVRALVSQHAVGLGIDATRCGDVLLAVNELASNSVRHAGGGGVLRVWTDGDTLVCEVSDGGRLDQPLAGRLRPPAGQLSGYGLWLVNQVCDLVQVRLADGGTVVRMHVRRS